MRRALALVLTAAAAVVIGLILGEYELTRFVGPIAGVVIGLTLAELALAVDGRRDLTLVVGTAVLSAGCVLWAGWLDADGGVEPYPVAAWTGAAAAAIVAAARLVPRIRPRP